MICKHILLITFLNKPKLILLHTVKWFQVLLCITNNSIKHHSFVNTQLYVKTVILQIIQSSISHLFAHSLNLKHFYLTLSGVTTLGQSESKSHGNEGVFRIPESSSIIRASPSDCLMSYIRTLIRGGQSYPSAEIELVHSTAPANWDTLSFWFNKFYKYSISTSAEWQVDILLNKDKTSTKTPTNADI